MAIGPGSAAMDLSTTLSSAYRYNQNMMEYYTCKTSFSLIVINFAPTRSRLRRDRAFISPEHLSPVLRFSHDVILDESARSSRGSGFFLPADTFNPL